MSKLLVFSIALGLFSSLPAGAEVAPADQLRKAEPIACVGDDDIVLRDQIIQTDGNAIVLKGNCDVLIDNSRIIAGKIAILVDSNSDVVISNSHIEGGQGSFVVRGNGAIEFSDSVVRGGTQVAGNGDLIDGGGNDLHGAGPMSLAVDTSDADLTVSTTVVDIDGAGLGSIRAPGVSIDGSGISAPGVSIDSNGISVDGADSVKIDGSGVRVGGADGVIVDSSGWVSVGSAVSVDADWRSVTTVYTAVDTQRLLIELGAQETDAGTELQLAGDVLFDFDRADLKPDAAETLAKLAHVLRAQGKDEVLFVGHTDSVGDPAYNQSLSEKRAVSVMQWLNQRESIPSEIMRGQGQGANQPIADNSMPDGSDNPSGRAKNRRVEIRIASR